MRYLVTFSDLYPDLKPFFTNWYDHENNYTNGMQLFDLVNKTYSVDGINWMPIDIDHL